MQVIRALSPSFAKIRLVFPKNDVSVEELMPSLSVIVIVKNEAHHIRRCLASVAFADEVVVLDSGSTDGTQDLCRALGAKVIETDWPGFGPQKNRALSYATKDWVFSIDADEWCEPAIQTKIQALVSDNRDEAYAFLRLSLYCGSWIYHGQWANDYVTRLFKRNKARFSDDIVHEKIIPESPVRRIRTPLKHEAFLNFEQMLNTMNRYSSLSADMKYQQGKKSGLLGAIGHGVWTFFRSYILKLGFLDGRAGFMMAVSSAEGSYYRYVKLMFAYQQQKKL